MARKEARILVEIWKDKDFRALPRPAQGMYLFLLSQPDLSYCGVLTLRARHWASTAEGMTVDDVMTDLKVLASQPKPFVVVDEETEEVFVRSLIRRDEIWKQPNLMKAARGAAKLIDSPAIRAALVEELKRIPIEESDSALARRVLAGFLEDFGVPSGFPSDIPPGNPSEDPSRKGSEKGSGNPSGNPSANPSQEKGVKESSKDSPAVTTEGSSLSSEADAPDTGTAVRDDVERVCTHLADRIEGNGSKRPNIGKGWRDAARLLIDGDGKTEQQIHNMIDWCQGNEWWRSRIMSMPKLREKYDALRLQALSEVGKTASGNARDAPGTTRSTTDDRVAQAADVARRLAERETSQAREVPA